MNNGFSHWLNVYTKSRRSVINDKIKRLINEKKVFLNRIKEYQKKLNNKRISKLTKILYQTQKKEVKQYVINKSRTITELKASKQNILNSNPTELYKLLLQHKQITGVIVDNDKLIISTKLLKTQQNQVLGRYKIILRPTKLHIEEYEIRNLDYRYYDDDHYHVQNGHPCLGEFRDILSQYDKCANLRLVIDSLIYFLINAYTYDDSHCSKTQWNRSKRKIS